MGGRDERFVAAHRGGPLAGELHRLLALWAAECAEHVLCFFNETGTDDRLATAVAVARSWARGEVSVGGAREAAVAAHAAARDATGEVATAVARAAGHAVATAHMADHSLGAAYFALKAVAAAGGDREAEKIWQRERLPASLRGLVESGLALKYPQGFGGPPTKLP